MKRILILLLLPLFLFGCRANFPVAQQSGKEDMAFLLFVSPKKYAGKNVEVVVDENTPFIAKVVKQKKSNRRGTQYGIATGTRSINVSLNGETLYKKKIFLSTQEVKQIILP